MRSWQTSESAHHRGARRFPARLAVLARAALLLGITVSRMGMLSVVLTDRAHAQGTPPPVPRPLLPGSVAFDGAGNLYFPDINRHVVYESSLAGLLTVVAGNGVQGFSGDGGSATSAELNSPQGVVVGPDGTLYIADTANQRVRSVRGGVISTVAGNGAVGFSGDGGLATSATFRGPTALAIDTTGALLVCDPGNQRVRRIRAGLIQTVVGNGVQGFAGDGGAATNAELDTPMGLAVGMDGRIFVADAHNQRIRIVATNGIITTLAGIGVAGFAGDGGPSTAAQLSLPRGLFVTSSGTVIFADANNQRLRMMDASGTMTTIAGSGLQGVASDGTLALEASMNSPRAVAVSSFGSPVYVDALNHLVRESVANGSIYLPAGLAPTRTSALTLNTTSTGGQTNASVSVAGSAGIPQGIVQLLDGTVLLTQATLVTGTATFATQLLSTGTHSLSAAYLGDGVNPAATSAAILIDSGTGVITATANPATIQYGQATPLLTGTLTGEPIQGVWATFTITAGPLSPVGLYPIGVSLSGPASANYTVVLSPQSGLLHITPAASITTLHPITQNSYAGLPLLLSARVVSTTAGTPTGLVAFLDNNIAVATASLIGGAAMGTYLSPGTGPHSIVASYAGDGNFQPSSSQAVTTTVAAMPDFSVLASGSTTQTVAQGDVAIYGITVAPQSGAFTGVVDFSASGLPTGATSSFSPPQLVPGGTSVNVTLSVQTSASLLTQASRHPGSFALIWLLLPFSLIGNRGRRGQAWWTSGCLMVALTLAGCGARTLSSPLPGGKTYTLIVHGTSTNLAGTVVSHSTQVTLVVE